jgi:RNA polymerase sigma-70 factor (ECF subfamily)
MPPAGRALRPAGAAADPIAEPGRRDVDDEHRLILDQVPYLRRYARALARDRDLAEDMVQDCLARAIGRLHMWQPGSNMRGWLFAILHNQFVNAARRRTVRPDQVALAPGHEKLQSAAPEQESLHALRDIDRAIAALPEDQRQTVLLIGLEGFSYEEAADILAVPVGTVMSRLSRGRRRLREILKQDDAAPLRVVK